MKNFAKLALISSSLSLVLTACQPSVSGKYLCLNPNAQGIAEELTLNFTSDNQVTVSFAYKNKNTGKPQTDLAVPSDKNYKYVIEDKKLVILGVNYGLFGFGTTAGETFLIQGNELVHYDGKFFGGHQCKKQ
jgi:hypothetical protein